LDGGLKGRDYLGDLDVDGEVNIKMDLEKIGCEGVDCIQLAQDRNKGRSVVKTVMNLRFP
jgi:hypothetical protein